MNCINCQIETSNPKFCGKSCAASHNNRHYPKRKPESSCARCRVPNTKTRTYCMKCWKDVQAERSIVLWENSTLGEMRGVGNANAGGRYPYIRQLSRRKYLLSNRPKECLVCGYSKHFDVAHVREVKSFPETAFVSEINDLDNLVALCKTHHWELDHGELTL